MEAVSEQVSDGQISAMKDDISSTIRKRRILMALLPQKVNVLVPFISHLVAETSLERKRCLVLCPPGKVSLLRDIASGTSGSVVGIDAADMRCGLMGAQTHASEVSLHCFTPSCMEGCPQQKGFSIELYRKLKEASGSFEGIDAASFLDSGMCPAKTLLDIASESSVVIADHSFFFSMGSEFALSRIGIDPVNTVISVMDPMSCVERIWEERTYTLKAYDLQTQAWPLGSFDQREVRTLEILFDNMRRLIQNVPEEAGTIDRKALLDGLRKDASQEGMDILLPDVANLLRERYASDPALSLRDRSRLRYLEAMIGLWHHQHSTVVRYARREPEPSLTISLIAPQVLTSTLSSDYHSAVIFGDTVYPHDTFVRLLGLTLNKVNNRTYLDRSDMKDLTVAAFTDVDTSMRLRLDQRQDDQYPVIASTLAKLARRAPGRTLAVFPSYNFLERTMEELRFSHPVKMAAESRGMRKEDRDRLLTEVTASEDVLVLAVQNGSLAKAFETGAFRASTAVVVGLQFNPPTFESNQMKLFFHENYGSSSGETISRVLPAAQKAMRMVNAQMYSEGKGRLVVLMDRRYHDRRNLEALPPFWDIRFISDPESFPFERLGSE